MTSSTLCACQAIFSQSIGNQHQIQPRQYSSFNHDNSNLFNVSLGPRNLTLETHKKLRQAQVFSNYIENPSIKHSICSVSARGGPSLTVGIIGFGNFGQFIAQGLLRQGHHVLATSRADYSEYCQQRGIQFLRDIDGLCEEQPDVIFVCSSILSTEAVVRRIPFHKLKPDTIFADVLSVKQFPRNLFLEVLPPGFGIICSHPMFGPDSGKNGWEGLPFVFDKVRVAENSVQDQKCKQFLATFENEGCRMVEMSCEEHDRHSAGSQFITHTIGRILSQLNLDSTPINTKGFESLMQLTETTMNNSYDLYYGLFMYNVNATEQIRNLDRAFEMVKKKLFSRLHDIIRKQIVERVPPQAHQKAVSSSSSYFLRGRDDTKDFSSFAAPPAQPPPELTNSETTTSSTRPLA